jgi:hypothetical protein
MPVAATRKRKQTDDMVDPTPPKRVTRARAAKAEEEPVKTVKAVRTAKITTASTRAVANAKAAATKPTRAASKKQPAAEEAVEASAVAEETEKEAEEGPAKSAKTRGRPKKTVTEEVPDPAPKTRTRQTKAVADSAPKAATATTRASRAKKVVEKSVEEDEVEESKAASKLATATTTKKATRSRPAAASTKADAVPAKKTTTRKRVTFEEEGADDKENKLAPTQAKKAATKTTGLLAKPVRKPAVATRATRARKVAPEKDTESKPLSPKKVTQVAKSVTSGSGSEDELCGTSPVKTLSRSPIKPPTQAQSPTKRPAQEEGEGPSSPTPVSPVKHLSASIFASPAKRALASPFKDGLKESPKRVPIPGSLAKPSLEASSQSVFKDALKASPKRVNLGGSVPQPQFSTATQSAFKQSLLQSPARRPASPFKTGSLTSPRKLEQATFNFQSPLKGSASIRLSSMTPMKVSTPPHEGGRMEEESIKSHHLTPAEQAALRSRETSPSPVKSSPYKLDAEQLLESPSSPEPGSSEVEAHEPVALHFSTYRSPIREGDSEDELQSGPFTMVSPLKLRNVSVRDFALDTPAAKEDRIANPFGSTIKKPVEALSMTPLALQLGSWCASSAKKEAEEVPTTSMQGIASPTGPTLLQAQPAQFTFQSPGFSGKVSHFDEQMFGHGQEPLEILEDADLHENDSATVEDVDAMDIDTAEYAAEASSEPHRTEESESFEQYGDENTAPVDPLVIFAPVSQQQSEETPADSQHETLQTPEQAPRLRNREIHTVSKVPLRAADDGHSPIKVPRKRAKSSFGPLSDVSADLKPMRPRTPGGFEDVASKEGATSGRKVSFETLAINQLLTPGKDGATPMVSPLKSVRKGADAQILRGAVIHVDVHTSEGADASGVFVELLTSMGAKCVKQWTWNPRASSTNEQAHNSRIGVTHVVYKDGGKRTLQKVREAQGLVLCVGVGWVLE